MFVWTSIAHMALPLGEAGINEIPNESAVLSAMQSSMGDKTGLYVFPQPHRALMLSSTASARDESKISERPCQCSYPRARSDLRNHRERLRCSRGVPLGIASLLRQECNRQVAARRR